MPITRLAGRLGLAGIAVALGLSFMAGSPSNASAMPCGLVRDNDGSILTWIECPLDFDRYARPDPCICPDPRLRLEDIYLDRWDDSVLTRPAAGLTLDVDELGLDLAGLQRVGP